MLIHFGGRMVGDLWAYLVFSVVREPPVYSLLGVLRHNPLGKQLSTLINLARIENVGQKHQKPATESPGRAGQ